MNTGIKKLISVAQGASLGEWRTLDAHDRENNFVEIGVHGDDSRIEFIADNVSPKDADHITFHAPLNMIKYHQAAQELRNAVVRFVSGRTYDNETDLIRCQKTFDFVADEITK